MATDLHGRSLLTDFDLAAGEVRSLLDLAASLKRARAAGRETPLLAGRNIALIFEKASTRTRCAFEVAAHEQGAQVTLLDPSGSHMGAGESIRDTARVLGRMYDGIEFRGFEQTTIDELARFAGVPVWNGLTDRWHPTQALADLLTMSEHASTPLAEVSCCFVGDGHNNTARSLLVTGAKLGVDVRIAAPRSLWPDAAVRAAVDDAAAAGGARVLVTDDVAEAVRGVDFVYTDVWVSMGEPPATWEKRIDLLAPYQVDERLITATGNPDVKFMHCLPALHDRGTTLGERLFQETGRTALEVTDDVFESERSIVFDQAENRLHTIKALMVATIGRT